MNVKLLDPVKPPYPTAGTFHIAAITVFGMGQKKHLTSGTIQFHCISIA